VQVLRDTLAAAQLGDAVLAAQAFQNDPDLFLRRILLACRPADVLDDLLGRILRQIGMLSHLRSCERYDEPETLPSSIRLICLMSADGGQYIPTDGRQSLRAGTLSVLALTALAQSLSSSLLYP